MRCPCYRMMMHSLVLQQRCPFLQKRFLNDWAPLTYTSKYYNKNWNTLHQLRSCEIEDFVETHIFASCVWYSARAYYGLCVRFKDIGRRLPLQLQCSYQSQKGDLYVCIQTSDFHSSCSSMLSSSRPAEWSRRSCGALDNLRGLTSLRPKHDFEDVPSRNPDRYKYTSMC